MLLKGQCVHVYTFHLDERSWGAIVGDFISSSAMRGSQDFLSDLITSADLAEVSQVISDLAEDRNHSTRPRRSLHGPNS